MALRTKGDLGKEWGEKSGGQLVTDDGFFVAMMGGNWLQMTVEGVTGE